MVGRHCFEQIQLGLTLSSLVQADKFAGRDLSTLGLYSVHKMLAFYVRKSRLVLIFFIKMSVSLGVCLFLRPFLLISILVSLVCYCLSALH